jgi:hypothetical protein
MTQASSLAAGSNRRRAPGLLVATGNSNGCCGIGGTGVACPVRLAIAD